MDDNRSSCQKLVGVGRGWRVVIVVLEQYQVLEVRRPRFSRGLLTVTSFSKLQFEC